MENRNDFSIWADYKTELCCYEWPVEDARAVAVIIHGMAEHAARYGRFAQALNAEGIAAVSMDLRGHGATAAGKAKGWFAKKDGWKVVLEDIHKLTLWAQEKYPDKPLVLLGHSMGSIFARAVLYSFGNLFCSAILSGVTVDEPGRRDIAPTIAGILGTLQGRDKPSSLLDGITFGAYNKRFMPARTRFDWLSRDPKEVEKYVLDGDCGFICTGSMFVDISRVLLETLKSENVAKIPKELPIFIVSGTDDPVGSYGAAAAFLEKQYREAHLDVSMKLYSNARHELLNEINRDEVTKDLIDFINGHL